MIQVVKFGASWCGPCKAYHPIFEEVSKMEEYKDISFHELDIDDEEGKSLASMLRIMSVPTTIIIKDGTLLNRISGALPKEYLMNFINDNK